MHLSRNYGVRALTQIRHIRMGMRPAGYWYTAFLLSMLLVQPQRRYPNCHLLTHLIFGLVSLFQRCVLSDPDIVCTFTPS